MPAPRALLSTFDRTGLADFARGLHTLGFELVASGGTGRSLGAVGLSVASVESLTGYPEMLGGRVKTLHPAIHGGILAKRTPEHLSELAQRGLAPIDLVAVNLYPFSETISQPDVSLDDALEQIDIGGVALLRAAAKNFPSVLVVCDPTDYPHVLSALHSGSVSLEFRRKLAKKAFRHTATYDAAIASYLAEVDDMLPSEVALPLVKVQDLRYGENPHQQAAFYRLAGRAPLFQQLHGKELSYNNLLDLDAAWGLAREFSEPAFAIIKHTNPCGCAVAGSLAEAYPLALAGDPVSAFGGIIAVNRPLDLATVEAIGSLFVEVIIAPGYEDAALTRLTSTKRDCRVMMVHPVKPMPWALRSLSDGILVQTPDVMAEDPRAWQVVTRQRPTEEQCGALAFSWRVCKHTKSNAIVFARTEGGAQALVGTGAGQMSRVDSVRLAVGKAGKKSLGAVMASDAFFPFPDGVEEAARAGICAIAQPGGSKRDADVIATADAAGIAMCFTGVRHFRH